MSESEELTLNSGLVNAVIQLIDFYSKKAVFKLEEYTDVATINTKLVELKKQYDDNKEPDQLSAQELAFIVGIFREGSQRIPTSIDSFGQLYAVYQHFQKLLEQVAEKEKKKEEDSNVPTVEELNEEADKKVKSKKK